MKKIFSSIMLVAFTAVTFAQTEVSKVNWVTFDEALKIQKKEGKKARPIFVDVFTEWCGPCKLLDKTTFQDEMVIQKLNNEFIAVKFNGEGSDEVNYKGVKYSNPNFNPERKGRNSVHDFTKHLELVGYPSLFVFDKNGDKVKTIVGYRNGPELVKELEDATKIPVANAKKS